jgi:hypothetical protein
MYHVRLIGPSVNLNEMLLLNKKLDDRASRTLAEGIVVDGLPSVTVGQVRSLPNTPAIYFVLIGARVVYVGETCRLRERWCSHVYSYTVDCCMGSIAYLAMSVETRIRRKIEAHLINRFQPILNGGNVRLLALDVLRAR